MLTVRWRCLRSYPWPAVGEFSVGEFQSENFSRKISVGEFQSENFSRRISVGEFQLTCITDHTYSLKHSKFRINFSARVSFSNKKNILIQQTHQTTPPGRFINSKIAYHPSSVPTAPGASCSGQTHQTNSG
jgi:hypothetical protein